MSESGPADAGAEVFWVCRDGGQGLGRDLEQEVVDDGLVLVGDVGDGRRQREHRMKVRYRQQIGLARGEPFLGGRALTLRTMAITTGNGCRPLVALWADPVMGSWRRADRVFEQVATSPLSIMKCA